MDPEAVELLTRDGTRVRGERHGASSTWAVLVHDENSDLDACRPLAAELRRVGIAVLAIDLRGHGASDGRWDPVAARHDVGAAVWTALARGAEQVFLVAAGTACEPALADGLHGAAAAVLLSPRVDPGVLTPEVIAACTAPKLVVVGGADPDAVAAARAVEGALIGPRLTVTLPTARQGARLLTGATAAQALSHTSGFLVQNRRAPRWRSADAPAPAR